MHIGLTFWVTGAGSVCCEHPTREASTNAEVKIVLFIMSPAGVMR
ncbi:hypothetical protein VISI1226_10622 [Vibrio sinaloensis DSM 21326]|uniref:Uncharacterized protein n=1 Tax=Vibrio sinaloensis DSM 21326 TaxID=945550 RepID=E8MAU6_PHOS4|nr:hypothetical protein VISI1226_10622 [Vibrio sinaloensis DSM 21326]